MYSLKDNKATDRNCGFKVMPCTFRLKRKRLKGGPRHLLMNLKCTVMINLSRSHTRGTSFVEVRRETDLSSVLILVADGIWGMCVLFVKLEA